MATGNLGSLLKDNGWDELSPQHYQKDQFELLYDTSNWIELYVGDMRVFDVPVLDDDLAQWTFNLINTLFRANEKLLEKNGKGLLEG